MTAPITPAPGTALPWRVEQDTDLIWGACNPDDQTTYGMGYSIVEGVSRYWPNMKPDMDERNANAAYIVHACNTLPALQEHADALCAALEQRDQTAAECPVDSLNPVIRKQNQDRCTICGSGVRDACGRKSSANYAFIEDARAALAAYQATKL